MSISPQLGQSNFTASVPGAIVLLQDVHVGSFTWLISIYAMGHRSYLCVGIMQKEI